MDRLLKDRKMASASARRQRVQERNQQNQILRQQREDSRHRRVWYNSETSSSADESSRCESPENDSAFETPSEYSARTPDNLSSPEVEISSQTASMSHQTIPSLHIGGDIDMIPSLDVKSEETLMDTDWLAPLNTKTTDFPYYRFSTFVGLPKNTRKEVEEDDERTPVMEQISEIESEEIEEEGEEEEEDYDEEEDEEDEDDGYSPIEVATSVAYSLPQNKPSLISVSGSQTSPVPPRRRGLDLMHDGQRPPLTLPTSPVRSYTFESKHSYFPSISTNSHSRTESNATSFITVSSTQDDADFTVKKKHSIPMLGKFTHNRIHSLKNFIKPNPLQVAPDLPQVPSRHHQRPSNPPRAPYQHEMMYAPRIQSRQLPAEPRRSLTELNFQFVPEVQMRPQTAHNPNQHCITTAPLSVNIPGSNLFMNEELRALGHGRKKSFSDLRKRNGSISSVLKMTTSVLNLVPEKSPLPPVPSFDSRPSPSESRPITRMPNHISKTSAAGRSIDYSPPNHFSKLSGGGRIAPYSPFPRAGRPGELVGLGLRT